jgi:hypothetical protein
MDLDELLPSSPKLKYMRLGLSCAKVRLPRTAVFTSLKDLTLEFLELAVGSGHLLARLLSSVCCPSLQKLRMMRVNLLRAGTKELVLDTGELLELSMEAVEGMELLELRTPKLLYLEIDECYHKSLRVSAPGLEDLTYVCNKALVHDPLPCVWCLKIDLLTHMEDDDDDGSNSSSICLLKHCSSSVRCLLVHPLLVPSVRIYLVRLQHLFALSVSHSFNSLALLDAKFKSDLLLTIVLFLLLNCICCF